MLNIETTNGPISANSSWAQNRYDDGNVLRKRASVGRAAGSMESGSIAVGMNNSVIRESGKAERLQQFVPCCTEP